VFCHTLVVVYACAYVRADKRTPPPVHKLRAVVATLALERYAVLRYLIEFLTDVSDVCVHGVVCACIVLCVCMYNVHSAREHVFCVYNTHTSLPGARVCARESNDVIESCHYIRTGMGCCMLCAKCTVCARCMTRKPLLSLSLSPPPSYKGASAPASSTASKHAVHERHTQVRGVCDTCHCTLSLSRVNMVVDSIIAHADFIFGIGLPASVRGGVIVVVCVSVCVCMCMSSFSQMPTPVHARAYTHSLWSALPV
jgi:hypothetical protein